MDFELSQKKKAFFKEVKEFAEREIAPFTDEYDRRGEFFWDAWKKMGDMGLLGLPFPEEYGGSGAEALDTAIAMDAFGAGGGDAGVALSWGAHTIIGAVPIWVMGTEEQKRTYLPGISSGEKISSFGLTEPDAGSDAASIKTTAVRDGEIYVINGTKMFITNGPIADLCIVIDVTDKEKGGADISAFIVEKGLEGFRVSMGLDKWASYLADSRAVLQRLPCSGGEPAGERGRRLLRGGQGRPGVGAGHYGGPPPWVAWRQTSTAASSAPKRGSSSAGP